MLKILSIFLFSITILKQVSAQQYGSFKNSYDGKVYKTVKIGEQVWMAENLNTDRFRNGDIIPEAKSKEEWIQASQNQQPAWCYYSNNNSIGNEYGKLYNWYAVNDPRGLSPNGWNIPCKEEWNQLIHFFGENSEGGLALKSDRNWVYFLSGGEESKPCPNCIDWNAEYRSKVPCHTCRDTRIIKIYTPVLEHPGNGTNSSGFSGIPGGYRYIGNGDFAYLGKFGYWWSSNAYNFELAWTFTLSNNNSIGFTYHTFKGNGYSVRCIKDNSWK